MRAKRPVTVPLQPYFGFHWKKDNLIHCTSMHLCLTCQRQLRPWPNFMRPQSIHSPARLIPGNCEVPGWWRSSNEHPNLRWTFPANPFCPFFVDFRAPPRKTQTLQNPEFAMPQTHSTLQKPSSEIRLNPFFTESGWISLIRFWPLQVHSLHLAAQNVKAWMVEHARTPETMNCSSNVPTSKCVYIASKTHDGAEAWVYLLEMSRHQDSSTLGQICFCLPARALKAPTRRTRKGS